MGVPEARRVRGRLEMGAWGHPSAPAGLWPPADASLAQGFWKWGEVRVVQLVCGTPPDPEQL